MIIATAFETKVDALLTVWINGVSANFVSAVTPLAAAAITVYIILMGWQIMRGEVTEPVAEIAKRLFRLAVIVGIACVGGGYQYYVIGGANAATSGLIATISATGGTTTPTTIGGVIDNIMTPYDQLYMALQGSATIWPSSAVALFISSIIVAIAELIVIVVALGFYLLAKVEVAICLAVGPLFVLLALFPVTQEWTKRWIGQLWNYSVQQALLAAAISMLQSVLTDSANQALNNYNTHGNGSVFLDVVAVFVVSLCVVVLILNIGALAQALSGAVGGIGHSGIQGVAGSAGNAAAGTAARMGKAVLTKGASLFQDAARSALARAARGAGSTLKQLSGPGGGGIAGAAGTVPAAQRNVLENL
jgi:type IV secretion system protein VirB6